MPVATSGDLKKWSEQHRNNEVLLKKFYDTPTSELTKGLCNRAVLTDPRTIKDVPVRFVSPEMMQIAILRNPSVRPLVVEKSKEMQKVLIKSRDMLRAKNKKLARNRQKAKDGYER